jgi:hypothetical protein
MVKTQIKVEYEFLGIIFVFILITWICESQVNFISITWEHVREAEFKALPQITESESAFLHSPQVFCLHMKV